MDSPSLADLFSERDRSITRSIDHSIAGPMIQSLDLSLDRHSDWSLGGSFDCPLDRLVDASIGRLITKSLKQPQDRCFNESLSRSPHHPRFAQNTFLLVDFEAVCFLSCLRTGWLRLMGHKHAHIGQNCPPKQHSKLCYNHWNCELWYGTEERCSGLNMP